MQLKAAHTTHTDVNPIFPVDWIFKNITLRSGFKEVFLEWIIYTCIKTEYMIHSMLLFNRIQSGCPFHPMHQPALVLKDVEHVNMCCQWYACQVNWWKRGHICITYKKEAMNWWNEWNVPYEYYLICTAPSMNKFCHRKYMLKKKKMSQGMLHGWSKQYHAYTIFCWNLW